MASVTTIVVSHRGVLPDNIKGSHSEKRHAPYLAPHASFPLSLLQQVLTLLLRSPSQCMFGSPWWPQLSSPPSQSCVHDFGGLFYCVPLCKAALARCWEPVRNCLTYTRLCQAEGMFKVGIKWDQVMWVSGVMRSMSVFPSGLMSMFVLDGEC